ncbi:MAG: esterase-like activity of phytase family protein [Elainellaceae cyanobacterium]
MNPIQLPKGVLRRSLCLVALLISLTGCAIPRVSAQDRLFLPVSVEFLDEYRIPQTEEFDGTPVRGLSGLSYDRERDRLYLLSDDRGERAPSRFYTAKLQISSEGSGINDLNIEAVTFLKAETGEPFATGSLDPEAIALSPRDTLFIASEGVSRSGIPPFINEFDLSGQQVAQLPIPERYVPQQYPAQTSTTSPSPPTDAAPQGVQDNRGFEALTVVTERMGAGLMEPFRVFAAIEEPLVQDALDPEQEAENPDEPARGRLLHYLVGEDQTLLIAEHLYPIEPKPFGAFNNGLVELLPLDPGHFLSLERSFGLGGNGIKLFQIATGGATDTSGISRFSASVNSIQPIRKRLVLDLKDIGIELDNIEGMTYGPRLSDGSRSLLMISDDNFSDDQFTQLLLFRLG